MLIKPVIQTLNGIMDMGWYKKAKHDDHVKVLPVKSVGHVPFVTQLRDCAMTLLRWQLEEWCRWAKNQHLPGLGGGRE